MQLKPLKCEERPWGRYVDHFRTDKVVFKLIYVAPFKRLSLQFHEFRDEVWVHISGKGEAVIDDNVINLLPGSRLIINAGQSHRLINISGEELVIAEMQHGECSESDIVRIEDDFGRVK